VLHQGRGPGFQIIWRYFSWSNQTYAKKSGMEPGITKRIMGHSLRSDVTEYYYTHPEFSDFERELRKLSFD